MSRGIIEAQTLRSEQFEFEARTSDPGDAQPGEYWIRTDQTSTNPDVIAELRRQDTSGVTTCPIFADAEESNLGADVTRGPSVVLDDASVGFVAMTTGDGEVGSPRAVTSAGAQYVSHNALELATIPDSGVLRLTYDNEDTESGTALDVWNDNDGSINGATTGQAGIATTWDSGESYEFAASDTVNVPSPGVVAGGTAGTWACWINPDNAGASDERIVTHGDEDYWLQVNNNDIRVGVKDLGGNATFIDAGASLSNGSPYFVGGGYDGSELFVQVGDTDNGDGTFSFDNTTSLSITIQSTSSATLQWAGPASSPGGGYDGGQDDPRLYSKGLSAEEWSNLYNTGRISG